MYMVSMHWSACTGPIGPERANTGRHREASSRNGAALRHDAQVLASMQVDLAANATDNELRVQADRHAAAKAEVDPIKAVTSMAAVLGGKFFLLQVRPTPLCRPPHIRPLCMQRAEWDCCS